MKKLIVLFLLFSLSLNAQTILKDSVDTYNRLLYKEFKKLETSLVNDKGDF